MAWVTYCPRLTKYMINKASGREFNIIRLALAATSGLIKIMTKAATREYADTDGKIAGRSGQAAYGDALRKFREGNRNRFLLLTLTELSSCFFWKVSILACLTASLLQPKKMLLSESSFLIDPAVSLESQRYTLPARPKDYDGHHQNIK